MRDGRQVIAQSRLADAGGRAQATMRAALSGGHGLAAPTVQVGHLAPIAMELPSLDRQQAQAMLDASLRFEPSHLFSENTFPTCHFEQPVFIEGAIGQYDIDVQYYDAAHQPVKIAQKPGRYGAVVKVTAEDGRLFTRYRTLFRLPGNWEPWNGELGGNLALPTEFGLGEEVQQRYRRAINEQVNWGLFDNRKQAHWLAVMLAGLWEAPEASITCPGRVIGCGGWPRSGP
ncbi:hypothetical protein HQ520_03415 [bacterium]|nr:hypothetical protein [bacterium]